MDQEIKAGRELDKIVTETACLDFLNIKGLQKIEQF